MSIQIERRMYGEECVVCGNDIIRLCVVREGATMEVLIQVLSKENSWITWGKTSIDKCLYFQREDGGREVAKFHAFSLEEKDGDTIGLTLHGRLGAARVNYTSLLHPMSIWTEHFIEINGDIPAGVPLHHCLMIPGFGSSPEICWPLQSGDTTEHTASLAAFIQDGSSFAAFVPLHEHSRSGMRITDTESDGIGIEYHVIPDCEVQQADWAFSYLLCMDPHAQLHRGFQQVVRMLGSCGVLVASAVELQQFIAGEQSALPQVPATAADWIPFKNEGTLPEIASYTRQLLAQADDDYRMYDAALCWIDRLALQQHG